MQLSRHVANNGLRDVFQERVMGLSCCRWGVLPQGWLLLDPKPEEPLRALESLTLVCSNLVVLPIAIMVFPLSMQKNFRALTCSPVPGICLVCICFCLYSSMGH